MHRGFQSAYFFGDKRRRYGKNYSFRTFYYLVYVVADMEFVRIEFYRGEVVRIVMVLQDIFYRLFGTDVPTHFFLGLAQHLDYGRGPTATADNRHFIATIVHLIRIKEYTGKGSFFIFEMKANFTAEGLGAYPWGKILKKQKKL